MVLSWSVMFYLLHHIFLYLHILYMISYTDISVYINVWLAPGRPWGAPQPCCSSGPCFLLARTRSAGSARLAPSHCQRKWSSEGLGASVAQGPPSPEVWSGGMGQEWLLRCYWWFFWWLYEYIISSVCLLTWRLCGVCRLAL